MSMGYCDGMCEYLERDKRHHCAKYKTGLGYIRRKGSVSFTAHEQCIQCQKDEWEREKEERARLAELEEVEDE